MSAKQEANDLGIASRIHRSRGRGARVIPASTKVTHGELEELEQAAKREGKALSEWFRDVLLREARSSGAEAALFTEVIALRQLLNMVLRPMALGEKLTPEAYAQVLGEIRTTKHRTAKEVLAQYERPNGGQ